MLIDCPACARSYPVARSDIGENGRTVICPRCSHRWFVESDGTNSSLDVGNDPQFESLAVSDGRPEPMRAARMPSRVAVAVLSLGVMAAGVTGAVAGRDRVARFVPRAAALYARLGLAVDAGGLRLGSLAPTRLASGDISLSGTIRNVSGRPVELPRLCFEVRDAGGTLLMSWRERTPSHRLAPGRRAVFTASPHRLPPEARRVAVRFVDDPEPMDEARRIADSR